MWKEKEEPKQETGEQCTCPYECWYYEYCHTQRPEQIEMGELQTDEEIDRVADFLRNEQLN